LGCANRSFGDCNVCASVMPSTALKAPLCGSSDVQGWINTGGEPRQSGAGLEAALQGFSGYRWVQM
jgi:hypothetical protein